MKELLKKQLLSKKKKQVAQLLSVLCIILLTACGVNKDFAAATKSLIGTMDAVMQMPTADATALVSATQFYSDKWGIKATSKNENAAFKHVISMSGYVVMYSVEKDDTKKSDIRKKYLAEEEAVNKILK